MYCNDKMKWNRKQRGEVQCNDQRTINMKQNFGEPYVDQRSTKKQNIRFGTTAKDMKAEKGNKPDPSKVTRRERTKVYKKQQKIRDLIRCYNVKKGRGQIRLELGNE